MEKRFLRKHLNGKLEKGYVAFLPITRRALKRMK